MEPNTRSSVFLIHGFRGSKFGHYYQDFLEDWVTRRAKVWSPQVTARVFRFDASAILSRGKKALDTDIWRLRRFLLALLNERARHDGEETPGGDVTLSARSADTRNILFIAHGLGSWIVKDVLAHPSSGNIPYTYSSTKVSFADSPYDIDKDVEDSYREYLTQHWTTFNFGLPNPQSQKELITYLQEIDDNFEALVHTYASNDLSRRPYSTEQAYQTIYRGRDLALWMSDRRLMDPKEVCLSPRFPTHLVLAKKTSAQSTWTDHLPRFVFGKHVSASRAEAIGKLPMSLEVTFDFSSNNVLQPGARNAASSPVPIFDLDLPESSGVTGGQSNAPSPAVAGLPDVVIPGQKMVTTSRDTILYPDIRKMPSFQEMYGRRTLGSNDKDEEVLSVVSTPYQDPNTFSNQLWSVVRLASSFLQKGELENSQVLFEKALKYKTSDTPLLAEISIDIQIAAVKMYRGKYEQSKSDLHSLKSKIARVRPSNDSETQTRDHLRYHCRRWLTSCMLLAGEWRCAASDMEALLDADASRFHVRLYRDLALAYAYLGEYGNARKNVKIAEERAKSVTMVQPDDQEAEGSERDVGKTPEAEVSSLEEPRRMLHIKQDKESRTKEKSVQIVSATLDMLSGDYTAALAASSDSLDFMNTTVGARHLKTLATSTLKGWCLAYNGRYGEAESLCSTTYKALTQALGLRHPQTLEAMECLVYVFRSQGRFAEAIGTGRLLDSLSSQRTDDLGSSHPQPIRAKFQLAESLLANGDYVASKAIFDELLPLAETDRGHQHPETLRYKSGQARVLLYLGRFRKAQDLALDVAVGQFDLLIQSQDCGPNFHGLPKNWRTGAHVDPKQHLYELLDNVPRQITMHPFLISNMQLLANIEVRRVQQTGQNDRRAELALARKILEALRSRQPQTIAESTPLSTSIEFDLAILLKEENSKPNDMDKSIELFSRVYEIRKKQLGENHLDTLCAQRELIIARCLRHPEGIEPDDNMLGVVKKASDSILKSLESRLGVLHPETLTSQLWCFTVDSLLQVDYAGHENKSWEDLSQNLSDPDLMDERLIESFVMKKRLAGLLYGSGNSQAALDLLDRTISEIDDAIMKSQDEELKEIVLDLKMVFEDLVKCFTIESGT